MTGKCLFSLSLRMKKCKIKKMLKICTKIECVWHLRRKKKLKINNDNIIGDIKT